MAIAYLANSFPEAVEAYVGEEMCELRRHGQRVVPCAVRRPKHTSNPQAAAETLYVFPLRAALCLRATFDCVRNLRALSEFIARAVMGPEPLRKRGRALVHTWLGVYFAALLRDRNNITHIHVHHGYFSSWIGMVTARILGATFSLTLHGSDLLVRGDYLDVKLKNCEFCVTISDFNRRHILANYPQIRPSNVLAHRIGIDPARWRPRHAQQISTPLILSVGRLHPVKNYSFLIQACSILKKRGVNFQCAIAGDGPERPKLEATIRSLGLQHDVTLLGQVAREGLPELYAQARVVILTSMSEGIPITLMEAMAMGKLVLAPRITGIPELVEDGETGFLYRPNSLDHCVEKLQFALSGTASCEQITKAARDKIESEFNSAINLPCFAADFLERVCAADEPVSACTSTAHENSVLQQI